MAPFDDPWSRLVSWLKVALPLLALALLSMLFLLARPTDPERAIPYAEVDVDELAREERVAAPTYSGVTRDGSAIRVTAEAVRPDAGDPQRLAAETVTGRIEMPTGASADMRAPGAVIDTGSDLARFLGGVTVETSTGYRMETETVEAALGTTEIVADTPVHAVGPPGTLDAGSMRIGEDEKGGYVLVFNGGVRLIYEPGPAEE